MTVGFIRFLKSLFGDHIEKKSENKIYVEKDPPETEIEDILSIWDYLSFQENSQAHHMVNVVGFDEWVDMEEIRRRIVVLFSIEYKNERSLYPYLKTLTDVGLFETSNVGGRRKWRKKGLLFTVKKKKKESEEEERAIAKTA